MEPKTHDVIIVGAGLSGLSAANFLKKFNPELDILLLEKTDRPGGAIQSMKSEGFMAEWGAHGFLDNVAESRELLDDLGLSQVAQRAPLKEFVRYMCLNGRLVLVPQSPPKIIASALMPLHSKIRVLADLVLKPRPAEQTIGDWVEYRFGKAMRPIMDAVITGTFAGDIDQLSIDAAMPGLRRQELEAGSLIRGLIREQKRNPRTGLPAMVSFEHGVEQLVKTLAQNKTIEYETPVLEIIKQDVGWQIIAEEHHYRANQVVVATHINRALPLLNRLKPAPRLLTTEARVFNVVLGFGPKGKIPFGFGYLAPKQEHRFALGALFPFHMFPGRTPAGMTGLEALVGGTRNPEFLQMDDQELVNRVYQDIQQLIPLPEPPVFTRVLRPTVGIPQLEIGHLELQRYRDNLEQQYPGLHVCGFGWEGIGINEMIKHAKTAATNLLKGQPHLQEAAPAKGVYF